MPRLRNTETGVVVNVDDATASRLGREWAPAMKAQEPKPAPRRRAPKKSK